MVHPPAVRELTLKDFRGEMLRQGGTMLGTTNQGDPFHFPMEDGSFTDRSQDIVDGYNELGLDALIVIGGDGLEGGEMLPALFQ